MCGVLYSTRFGPGSLGRVFDEVVEPLFAAVSPSSLTLEVRTDIFRIVTPDPRTLGEDLFLVGV